MIDHINLSNIHVGDRIKNYGLFCTVLEIPQKAGGKGKQFQLDEIQKRFFKFHKEGHAFIIDEIYTVPKSYERKARSGRYVDYGKPLLMDLLCHRPRNTFEGRTKILYKELSMVNSQFLTISYDKTANEVTRQLGINSSTYADFEFYASTLMNNVLNPILSGLKKMEYIEYRWIVKIQLKEDDDALCAVGFTENDTDETRLSLYDKAMKTVLHQMNCDSYQKCRRAGRGMEYNMKFDEYIIKEYHWYRAHKEIRVELTDKGYDEGDTFLDSFDLEACKRNINQEIALRLKERAEKERNKALGKQADRDELNWRKPNIMEIEPGKQHKAYKEYLEGFDKLIRYFIEI